MVDAFVKADSIWNSEEGISTPHAPGASPSREAQMRGDSKSETTEPNSCKSKTSPAIPIHGEQGLHWRQTETWEYERCMTTNLAGGQFIVHLGIFLAGIAESPASPEGVVDADVDVITTSTL
jgi:hypothetical protein